jgi:hypothetical protein
MPEKPTSQNGLVHGRNQSGEVGDIVSESLGDFIAVHPGDFVGICSKGSSAIPTEPTASAMVDSAIGTPSRA